MTIQTPTRITIEVHQPGMDAGAAPVVRVIPEAATSTHSPMAAEPREGVYPPAAFEPGECLCLDDADCNADHANE